MQIFALFRMREVALKQLGFLDLWDHSHSVLVKPTYTVL